MPFVYAQEGGEGGTQGGGGEGGAQGGGGEGGAQGGGGVGGGSNAGLELSPGCLTNGSCKLNIYQTLGIRESTGGENSTELLVQDVFLAATFFVGTVATVGLLVSGVKMVFGGADESQFESGKKGMKYSIIGIILVLLSYTLIRVVEFVAQGQR